VSKVESGRVTGKEWKFSGHFALGASDSSEYAKSSLGRRARGAARCKPLYPGGTGDYAGANGVQNQDDTIIYGQYDRLLSKKWYAYINASLENNRFNDIELRTIGGVGVGYHWLDTERTRLALEAGPSYVYTDYYTQPTEHNLSVRLATKFDYWIADAGHPARGARRHGNGRHSRDVRWRHPVCASPPGPRELDLGWPRRRVVWSPERHAGAQQMNRGEPGV